MRFNSIVLSAIVGLSLASGADPRLQIAPTEPHPGDTVTIIFNPTGGPLASAKSLRLVYGWTPYQWDRLPLNNKGKDFIAKLPIPVGVSYVWCWVEDPQSGEKDTNRGLAWDFYIYDDHGLPLQHARESRSLLYQLSEKSIDKLTAALNVLEEEVRAFPDNAHARGMLWALQFQDAGSTEDAKHRISSDIATYLASNRKKSAAYGAAAEGFYRIGSMQQALEVLRSFIGRFPEDSSFDDVILIYLGNIGTLADLESLQTTSKRWSTQPNYWEKLFYAYARSKADPDRLRSVGAKWLALIPPNRDTAGRIRIAIAESWLANGVDPLAAEGVARDAVSIAETGGSKFVQNSLPITVAGAIPRMMPTVVNRSTLGWTLYKEQRYQEALSELERAVAVGEKDRLVMKSVYYRLGQTLEKLNRLREAAEAYWKELAWGTDGNPALEAASALYSKTQGGIDGFEAEKRSRVNGLLAEANTAEPVQDFNEKIGRFDLRGVDGKPVSLDQFHGKVILIDFWGTWCPPCLSSLENSHRLQLRFPGQIVVVAVDVEVEELHERAQAFLRTKGYDFVTAFDDEHLRDLFVPYIPTRFLIDREGRLRSRELGATLASDLVFEQRLEALVGEPPR